MPIFLFYPCKTDGSSETFVTQQLQSDAQAADWAAKVILDHPRCASVAVWQGDRPVLTRQRLSSGVALNFG
jgi:hypothetical protein